MRFLFSLAVLLSAALLMGVQPMAARALVPYLGGSPSVWNTCLVFFQAGLLAGYAYAWLGPRIIGIRAHALTHVTLLAAALVVLPTHFPSPQSPPNHPVWWTLKTLALGVALPYCLLAATSTLLQSWYARATRLDPYFLYAASNLGSFLGLFAYPLFIEPNFGGATQADLWRDAFAAFLGLMILAAVGLCHSAKDAIVPETESAPPIEKRRIARWLLLAFAPSSLLLSVTHFVTADLLPAPILWVIPLALYLLSFVAVFARRPWVSRQLATRYVPAVILTLVVIWLSEATRPLLLIVGVLLFGLFWLAIFCHGELAATRPAPARLGEFYFWIALGGVLGGAFNVFAAPWISSSLLEFPLMLVLIGALRPWPTTTPGSSYLRAAFLGALAIFLVVVGRAANIPAGQPFQAILIFPLLATMLVTQPGPYAAALALVIGAGLLAPSVHGDILERRRSFFGVHTVTRVDDFIKLTHGTTTHGLQSLEEPDDPKAYYHRKSPIAAVIKNLNAAGELRNVAVVGLGSGALAAYAEPGLSWTFFELDRDVQSIAMRHFSYLANSPGKIAVVLGDARLTISQSDRKFDLLIIDAFGSDSIPAHLLTREAFEIYKQHLNTGGTIAIHISNRYLNLIPILGEVGWPMRFSGHGTWLLTDDDRNAGRMTSDWVVLRENASDLLEITPGLRWTTWQSRGGRPWTDDYINLLSVVKWDELISRE